MLSGCQRGQWPNGPTSLRHAMATVPPQAARVVPAQSGREARVSQDLAIKIGTAYTQQLLWKNSMEKDYHGVDKVRCILC